MPPKRETSWTIFVSKWANDHGVSYPCASTDPKCRAEYEAWKAKNGMKATRPRKAPGEPKRKYVRKDPNAPVVPKRKYVRKATTMAASTRADKTWVDDWAKSIGASFEAKPKRKYAPRKKREPTAAEFVSAVARLNANPSLMEWSKG